MLRRLNVVRAVAFLVALVFLRASARKLFGVEETARHFVEWGYPHWFLLLVATIELVGAALLLFRGTMRAGAVVLVPIMLGAIGTQVIQAAYAKAVIPALVLMALLVIAGRKTSKTNVKNTK